MTPPSPSAPTVVVSEAEVLDWAQRLLGPIADTTDIGRGGTSQRILEIHTRSDERAVVKMVSDGSSFHRTVEALSNYSPALGAFAPRLIDAHEGLRSILMTHVPGVVAEGTDHAWDAVVHFRAGVLLRQLHESGPATQSAHLAGEWAAALERAVRTAEPFVDFDTLREAAAWGMRVLDCDSLVLSPTHRANTPVHWLVHPQRGVHLVGFSHLEYDPWVVDTVYLERDYWRYSPDLRQAFFSGYERAESDEDLVLRKVWLLTDALSAWAEVNQNRSTHAAKKLARERLDWLCGHTLF